MGIPAAGAECFEAEGRSAVETAMSEEVPEATIRIAREDDWPQIVELLLRVFRRWPTFQLDVPPLEHLRWKMRSDPIAARHQWVTEIDGQIAATLLRVVKSVRIKGRDFPLRDNVDVVVDPRHQKRGLYIAMSRHAWDSPQYSELPLSFSYSTNPRIRRKNENPGVRTFANSIQVLEKPYRPRAVVARRRERHGGRLPAPLASLRIALRKLSNRLQHPPYWRSAKGPWSITTLERFDDRIDAFFEQASQPFDLVIVRGRDYLNWRYCDPAAGRFTVRAAEQQGRILGYLVWKITDGGAHIADVLALPGRTDVLRSLIEDALQNLRRAGVEQVRSWMISRHPYNRVLRRYGFIDSKGDVGFRYWAESFEGCDLGFLAGAGARIHLTLGDSDWI
jgi:hypothetical protein